MTSTLGLSVAERAHQRLLSALRPRDAHLALIELAGERFGMAPLACYLPLRGGERLQRDPGWPLPSQLPNRLASAAALPTDMVAVPIARDGKTLAFVLFPENVSDRRAELFEWVEQIFAPTYIRTAFVQEILDQNASANERLRFLREMGALLGQIDVEPLLINVLDLTCSLLESTLGAVVLKSATGALALTVDWGLPAELLFSATDDAGAGAIDRAVASGTSRILQLDGLGPSLLVLPLSCGEDHLGAVCIVLEDPSLADRTTLQIIQPAMALAAVAIDNARLVKIRLERERELAQLQLAASIQDGLLPKSAPPVPGLDLSATSVPASLVGGDYFDYFQHADGSVSLLVADVAGKGIPAALVMTSSRATFRAVASSDPTPAVILSRVNQALAGEDFRNRFVTAILARFDPKSGQLTVATAGHDPVLVVRSDGTPYRVGGEGLPLGILAGSAYTETTMTLEPGDVAVLWTDGVTEAWNQEREGFGAERLVESVARVRRGSSREILEQVLSAIDRHRGGHPRHDDTTLMVAVRS